MFMNRVHEQCPKIDSGTIPSQPGSKIGRVHRVHSPRPACAPSPRACRAPAARLPSACRAPATPCRARLPPSCLRAPRALSCRFTRLRAHCAPRLRAQLPAAPTRAPTHACLRAQRAPCAPNASPARPTRALRAQCAPSQRPTPSAPFLPQSRYSNCIMTQPPSQPTVSRYGAVL